MSEEVEVTGRAALVAQLEAFGVPEDYIKPHWPETRIQQDILMHTKQKAAREAMLAGKASGAVGVVEDDGSE